MNTVKNICRCLVGASLALVVAGLASLPASAQAQQKGAEKLIQLKPVDTAPAVQRAEAGSTHAMACSKCKDATSTVVEKAFKGANQSEVKRVTTHLCSACETKRTTQGQGKMAKEVVLHTCSACGSKEASCCAGK